jgi:hypothetical protein
VEQAAVKLLAHRLARQHAVLVLEACGEAWQEQDQQVQ